ncbi:MAG: hypothetical protein HND58_06155 [Planctomycetota bacterium]|nr:MAG: hypothetical protein HND58_06155 [Planctomycetota bacterium]
MMVLLIPAQAVIWPQIAMSAWPVPVVAALAASLAVWTLVIGGVLATGLNMAGPGSGRGWWMLVVVAARRARAAGRDRAPRGCGPRGRFVRLVVDDQPGDLRLRDLA